MTAILPCPNPECQKGCCIDASMTATTGYWAVCLDFENAEIGCGYRGPWATTKEEAIRLHNLICTHPHGPGVCVDCDDSGPIATRAASGGEGKSQVPYAYVNLENGSLWVRRGMSEESYAAVMQPPWHPLWLDPPELSTIPAARIEGAAREIADKLLANLEASKVHYKIRSSWYGEIAATIRKHVSPEAQK